MGSGIPTSGLVPYQDASFNFGFRPVDNHTGTMLDGSATMPVAYNASAGYNQGFATTGMANLDYIAGGYSGTGTNWNFTGFDLNQFDSAPISNEHSTVTSLQDPMIPEVRLPAPPPLDTAPATSKHHNNIVPSTSGKQQPKP